MPSPFPMRLNQTGRNFVGMFDNVIRYGANVVVFPANEIMSDTRTIRMPSRETIAINNLPSCHVSLTLVGPLDFIAKDACWESAPWHGIPEDPTERPQWLRELLESMYDKKAIDDGLCLMKFTVDA